MKILAILCAFLLFASFAAAECVEVVPLKPQLSSTDVTIVASADGKPAARAAVEVLVHGNETLFFLVADDRGVVKLPRLKPGDYSVVATSGDNLQSQMILLHVSDDANGAASAFLMDLKPQTLPSAAPAIASAAKAPVSERVREFKGVVQDPTGAAVSRALIEVFPKDSKNNSTPVGLRTDKNGHFSSSLPGGTYTAIIRSPGFRPWFLVFEITKEGETKELHATLQVAAC
jgi:carboxypeptidase family protein